MKNTKIIFNSLVVMALTVILTSLLLSCDDWTKVEEVDYIVTTPEEQNPELYARYAEAVRNYKARKHYLVCARFENGQSGEGEKNYLRSMPDSIDAVILEHANALVPADIEDIPILQRNFTTKILSSINLTEIKKQSEESGGDLNASLNKAIDEMLTVINKNGLDGASIAFTGEIDENSSSNMRKTLFDKIRPLAQAGKTFFFEGNLSFIPENDRDVFSCFILNTTSVANAKHLQLLVGEAVDFAGIPANKLLISADPDLMIRDDNNIQVSQVPALSQQVIDSGPVGGLLIRNIMSDYHTDPNVSYYQTRNAIQVLNPSPLIK